MKHIHAELMKQYAEDAKHLSTPYVLWEYRGMRGEPWRTLQEHPLWDYCLEYRRKECNFEPHPHQQLMQQYAEDAATCEDPWKYWQWKDQYGWNVLDDTPRWNRKLQFRPKPETKDIEINGITISTQILDPKNIAIGTVYYVPNIVNPELPTRFTWENTKFDIDALQNGALFLQKIDAINYTKAIIKAQSWDF